MSGLKDAIESIEEINLALNGTPDKRETGLVFRFIEVEKTVKKQHKWLMIITGIVVIILLKTGAIDPHWFELFMKTAFAATGKG